MGSNNGKFYEKNKPPFNKILFLQLEVQQASDPNQGLWVIPKYRLISKYSPCNTKVEDAFRKGENRLFQLKSHR